MGCHRGHRYGAELHGQLHARPNIERLTLAGAALNGTGNGLANILTGNSQANILNGGAGADTMSGGQATTPM
jgi:hypothetical protein